MTVNTPDEEIARHDALLALARTALSDLAAEFENLKQQILIRGGCQP